MRQDQVQPGSRNLLASKAKAGGPTHSRRMKSSRSRYAPKKRRLQYLVAIQVKNMYTLLDGHGNLLDQKKQQVTITGIVSVSEKLFQLEEILRMTYIEVKRDVEGFVMSHSWRKETLAQMTGTAFVCSKFLEDIIGKSPTVMKMVF